MLEQTGPKIDPNGKNGKSDKCDKMVILVKLGNGKRDRGAEMFKMLKREGRKIYAAYYW